MQTILGIKRVIWLNGAWDVKLEATSASSGMGPPSFVQVTMGGGIPLKSQGRNSSVPSLIVVSCCKMGLMTNDTCSPDWRLIYRSCKVYLQTAVLTGGPVIQQYSHQTGSQFRNIASSIATV